jgi:carbamoyltransferase
VALNSVMNTRLLQEVGFEEIFIQPAASDAGNALGAALWVWHQQLGRPRGAPMGHAFWGPEFSAAACEDAVRGRGLAARRVADAPAEAARLLAESRIVGWYQGRAEVGPRALGARSILADPRQPETKDIVNARVKRREAFRPFAPSVLHERGPQWFGGYYPNQFMLLVLPVRRLQTVTADLNPSLHRLISEFERRTGVPVVLNTSFNLRGEPIVLRPGEAVDDFLRSDMDALFLGDLLVEKHQAG